MEIGIIGFPQTGKKTLLQLLTEGTVQVSSSGKASKEPGVGISRVHDHRLDALNQLYKPKKLTPATITYLLLPSLSKNSQDNQAVFKSMVTVDAICHVVRAFSNETVFHIEGSVSPERDIAYVESELFLNDMMFTETRLERLEIEIKKKNEPAAKKEREFLQRVHEALNNEIPLRTMTFSDDEKKMISSYPYLTRKNMLIAVNADEDAGGADALIKKLEKQYEGKGISFVSVSCKIEQELASLDNDEERKQFLAEMGIERSALEKLTQASYASLGLISFFTVGEDEVRAWTIRKGAQAPQAGGAIHSDIERGFIRAEHMRVEDILSLGTEAKVKEAGKFNLKGKEYVVQDGDILHFRFNV